MARLQAIGEEARAALLCAEAARDATELANRELAAARASDRTEILQLRKLIMTSAVDQADLLQLRGLTTTFTSALEQIKTSSSDQDARLCALEKAASAPAVLPKTPAFDHAELLRHTDALDKVYKELDRLRDARDGIYEELDKLQRDRDNIYGELDELKAVRPRCPSPSWRVAAQEQLVAQESQLHCVKEEGVFTAARLEKSHDFTSADFTVHDLDVKMRKAILELRRDLLGLNTSWVVATQEATSCRSRVQVFGRFFGS